MPEVANLLAGIGVGVDVRVEVGAQPTETTVPFLESFVKYVLNYEYCFAFKRA